MLHAWKQPTSNYFEVCLFVEVLFGEAVHKDRGGTIGSNFGWQDGVEASAIKVDIVCIKKMEFFV